MSTAYSRAYARHYKWARSIGHTAKGAHIQAQQLARAEELRGRLLSSRRSRGEPTVEVWHKGRVWIAMTPPTGMASGFRHEGKTKLGAVRGLRRKLRDAGWIGSRA